MGSYLDARRHGARWLVRIEDLDTPRVVPGCADQQLRVLETLGFQWDGEVLYQSARREAYREALRRLDSAGRLFRCSCTRKDLAGSEDGPGYPGTCRGGPTRSGPTALRFRVSEGPIHFEDIFLGPRIVPCMGDVVVERRDGIATYQLAVVVDDACQGITRVVRGADLLDSTGWQLDLQAALGLARPIYGHLPVLTEPDGGKLAKSRRSLPLDLSAIPALLTATLTHLSQSPPPDLVQSSREDVWKWALANWNPQALAGKTESRLSAPGDMQADSAH
jgi:glutamyl-Q tRNA(Asp) synthetase